jgi:hypothetical protein
MCERRVMAELPISFHKRQHVPGLDAIRWHVGLHEDGADVTALVVDVSETAATQLGLSDEELDARLDSALQRYAAERLNNALPALDQVAGWGSPVVLRPDHFT